MWRVIVVGVAFWSLVTGAFAGFVARSKIPCCDHATTADGGTIRNHLPPGACAAFKEGEKICLSSDCSHYFFGVLDAGIVER
jgi:hypothetical protein